MEKKILELLAREDEILDLASIAATQPSAAAPSARRVAVGLSHATIKRERDCVCVCAREGDLIMNFHKRDLSLVPFATRMQLLGSLGSCRITHMYAHIERLAILHISRFICTLEKEKKKDVAISGIRA